MKTKLWAIGLVVVATFLTATGQLLYKIGVDKFTFDTIFSNYHLLLGLAIYLVAGITIIFSMKGGELSVIYPFIGLGFAWVTILSKVFLGEEVGFVKWLGVVIIFIGVTFIGIGAEKSGVEKHGH
ncbi:hypothetical protein ACFLZX_04610 [Nanoarchaeota archaeon]